MRGPRPATTKRGATGSAAWEGRRGGLCLGGQFLAAMVPPGALCRLPSRLLLRKPNHDNGKGVVQRRWEWQTHTAACSACAAIAIIVWDGGHSGVGILASETRSRMHAQGRRARGRLRHAVTCPHLACGGGGAVHRSLGQIEEAPCQRPTRGCRRRRRKECCRRRPQRAAVLRSRGVSAGARQQGSSRLGCNLPRHH